MANFSNIEFNNQSNEIDNNDLISTTDVNLLKYYLERQREKLFSIIKLIIKIEISYENMMLRIDYDDLLNKHNQLNNEFNSIRNEYQHLSSACSYLINKTRDIIDERNKYYHQWENDQHILTPRPDWDKVSNVIDGGIERWKILSTNKTSEQLVDLLINEIQHGNQSELFYQENYFQSIGDDSTILPFLRLPKHTRIFNRQMGRRITGILIKDIWTDKIKNLNQTHQTLADHICNYFEKRFDSKTVAIEMGYNLRDACLRYQNNEKINLFWGIITGQIDETVYHHQMKSISQLLQHFMKMKILFQHKKRSNSFEGRKAIIPEGDSPQSILINRRLSAVSINDYQESRRNQLSQTTIHDLIMKNEEFIESLKAIYPNKSLSDINELFLAAKYDLQYSNNNENNIEFSLLFIEDDESRYNRFLSTLIKQINQERNNYVEQVKQILLGYPLISAIQFSRAIHMIDPKISQNELNRYIEWIFLVKNYSTEQQIKPIELEDLLRRLENCACFIH